MGRRLVRGIGIGSALAALTACGATTSGTLLSGQTRPVAHLSPASPATVRTATCHSWKAMDSRDRQRLVLGMRTFFGGMVDQPGMRGEVVPAATAYKVFDGFCDHGFADSFRLYRLYGDEAAFTPAQNR